MYDTIKLYMPFSSIAESSNVSERMYENMNISKTTEFSDGSVTREGYLKNCRIKIADKGLTITGSLSKYYTGSNFNELNIDTTVQAIKMMSDELKMPLRDSLVRRFDIACNMIMDHKPEAYYLYLGEKKSYCRSEREHSLYYLNSLRKITFYDKIAESKAKNEYIPPELRNLNVLRFELGYMNRLPYQFNMPVVKAQDLYDSRFYEKINRLFLKEYKTITKTMAITTHAAKPLSSTESLEMLTATLILPYQQNKALQLLDNWNRQGNFRTQREYYRAKSHLKAIIKRYAGGENELIKELDTKVTNGIKEHKSIAANQK
jgi:hypothetical protein